MYFGGVFPFKYLSLHLGQPGPGCLLTRPGLFEVDLGPLQPLFPGALPHGQVQIVAHAKQLTKTERSCTKCSTFIDKAFLLYLLELVGAGLTLFESGNDDIALLRVEVRVQGNVHNPQTDLLRQETG